MVLSYGETGILVGMVGDGILQFIVKNSKDVDLWGLKTYFRLHGRAESIFVAGGMLGFFSMMYSIYDPTFSTPGLCLYGAILDLIFRYCHVFPSLGAYYAHFSVALTILWAIIPFLMVKYISKYL